MESEELFPFTGNTPVVRTCFDDDGAWNAVCNSIRQPVSNGGQNFFAYVEFVENPFFRNRTEKELLALVPPAYPHSFLFVVDRTAIEGPEFPVLVMDLFDEPGRTFRVIPSQIQGVQNNLSIANMDFYEFADNVDQDGVFRGF
ncbi:MAG TPA: hypothetical protein VFU68_03390 [Terracidiphilus sp.]|nr:hypothetical protein [Terracidiphilus sp.]